MKKSILIFISVFVMLFVLAGCKTQEKVVPFDASSIKQKINAYLFWGEGCPHCAAAKTFFATIENKYKDCYELVDYEVYNNADNQAIKLAVAAELGYTEETGVPLIVIGEEHFLGYSAESDKAITDAILNSCSSDSYKDIVKPYTELKAN